MKPEQWVRDITVEGMGGSSHGWSIGDRVRHPDGRLVEIVDGQYWGTYGLSNFWGWREVIDGGFGERESGYGW